jgi:uncharacterized membrane protein
MMNFNVTRSGMEGLMILATIGGLITTVFWMVVGWRAMRAHERLADAAKRMRTNNNGR